MSPLSTDLSPRKTRAHELQDSFCSVIGGNPYPMEPSFTVEVVRDSYRLPLGDIEKVAIVRNHWWNGFGIRRRSGFRLLRLGAAARPVHFGPAL
jgi:hypothetical protein